MFCSSSNSSLAIEPVTLFSTHITLPRSSLLPSPYCIPPPVMSQHFSSLVCLSDPQYFYTARVHPYHFLSLHVSLRPPFSPPPLFSPLFSPSFSLPGPIPSSLGLLPSLRELDLDNNQFTGSIPLSFSNLVSLRRLHLSSNPLTATLNGLLMPLRSLPELALLHASSCQIQGASDTRRLWSSAFTVFPSLEELDLHSNSIAGPIPPFTDFARLSRLSKLSVLSVSSPSYTALKAHTHTRTRIRTQTHTQWYTLTIISASHLPYTPR